MCSLGYQPVWTIASTDPLFTECIRYTQLWSYTICVIDEGVLHHPEKMDFVANVLAQVIDSDYDGEPDDKNINT